MSVDLNTVPEQVRNFVLALIANAKRVEGWDTKEANNYGPGFSNTFADTIPHVEQVDDAWVISDNYERFFDTIYTYNITTGAWTVRDMFSGEPERTYTYEKAMADAAIMFTG